MYECQNCGGNLKFDIGSQKLFCEYCGTLEDPYDVYKERDAEESTQYEVTIFTCPQCGGELLSEDTTAATFCNFCGGATILNSRISKERRPHHIIPFTKTREDCRKAYVKMVRRAIFAPKELRDEAHIEKFRGIYMPYWIYSFETKGTVFFDGSKSSQKGDYLITRHYTMQSDVDAAYSGIAYDASAAFSDNLSGAIAPFHLEKEKPFTPSFLSGFYADTSDVDSYVYEEEAQDMVMEDGARQISKNAVCSRFQVKKGKNRKSLKKALQPTQTVKELAMLPVWFLAYRKDDRVAYAVVNGQTGKAAADLPVDMKKYTAGSLFLALPIFLLLNLFFTIIPTRLLILAALLACVCAYVSISQLSNLMKKESGEEDKGYQFRQGKSGAVKKKIRNVPTYTLIMALALFCPYILIAEVFSGGSGIVTGILFVLAAAGIVLGGCLIKRRIPIKKAFPVLAKPMGAVLLAGAILVLNPVSDLYYYGGAVVSLGMVIWTLTDIIKRYNLLTMRKLPQLNRRGGEM